MIENFYKQFCTEGFDSAGVLSDFSIHHRADFNFGFDIVDEMARQWPDRLALLWVSDRGEERRFTFRDLKRESDKAANLFLSQGIGKGDRVLLILKRHYQFWVIAPALIKIGAVMIPASNLLTEKDLRYRYEAAGVRAIICTTDGDVADYADTAAEGYGGLGIRMTVNGSRPGWLNYDEEQAKAPADDIARNTEAGEHFLIYFTSGTTGNPKMAIHNHAYPLGHIVTAKYWHDIGPEDLHLTVSDTGWAKSAWGKIYGQWIVGATVFVYDYDKFDPTDLLRMIEKYRITSFCAPATVFRFFIKEGIDGHDLSSIRHATMAGEALNPEVFNRFLEYTGIKLMEGFGQSETTMLLGTIRGMEPKPGSMGRPNPMYDIDLVDPSGESVPPGEVGEIVVKIPEGKKQIGLFDGYYRAEDTTAEVWHDRLYHTKDTAWRDEDGFYWYVGRTDDVIKASGYRIGPFEIESVLMEHPAVLECAVTGAPDPIRGQVVKATVVLTKNHSPSDELVKELQDFVKQLTAPYKYPRIVEFIDELPKTTSGKIKRAELRQRDTAK